MQKLMIDGKEIEIDEKNVKQLSEEELECAAGGAGTFHSRWVCLECGFHGDWDIGSRLKDYQVYFHYQQTGHYNFKMECVNLSGPNDPLPD
jgi:hypothetical protein